jgi:hypothetical protein
MIIKKTDGTPFPTESNAKLVAGKKKLDNYKIVKVDGGFAIEVDAAPILNETKNDEATKSQVNSDKKPGEARTESFDLPENNVAIDENYEEEQPYPRAQFTGTFRKPKVTYIPKECKNPNFTYKFLLIEDFQHGDMCDNWQVDKEVIRNMRRNPKYRHLVSRSDNILRRGKRNELVLCRMPMEYKEGWRKELRERNKAALGRVENPQNDIHNAGLGG